MSQRPHPLERDTIRKVEVSFFGDRLVCLLQFAFLVVLPLGVVSFGGGFEAADRVGNFTFPGVSYSGAVIGFLVLWYLLWFGSRGAFVIYAMILGFHTVSSMVEKHGTPYFGLLTLTYLMLRLTHSVGPKLNGSKE